jgi:chemotaxis protein methyltransferase CheR
MGAVNGAGVWSCRPRASKASVGYTSQEEFRVAHTSFFRDADALKAIAEIALPTFAHRRHIRVWDAGCASGEEPYTLAMIFATKLGPFSFRSLDILATDHEESNYPQFAERIEKGLYSRKDVFWVPEALRARFFLATEDPDIYVLSDEIRARVRYQRHDLLSMVAPEGEKSLVVCKNVLMHFSPADQLGVLEMYWKALASDGFLALDGNQAMPGVFQDRFARVDAGLPLFRKREP